MNVIGIDLGGSKINAGYIDERGELLYKLEAATPIELGREGILAKLKEMIRLILYRGGCNIAAIGIGSAGRIERSTGRVLFATDNLPGWTGTNLRKELESVFGIPVFVENDAAVAALGERWLGSAREWTHYIFLTLGTGIGGTLVHNGEVLASPDGGTGELGHMLLYPHGILCNCGRRGCFEQYASGGALNRAARQIDSLWNSRILMEKFEEGDKRAVKRVRRFADDLALGLASLTNIYEPQAVIMGGGLMDTYRLWQDLLASSLQRKMRSPITIIPAQLGNEAGMIGAGRLALNELFKN